MLESLLKPTYTKCIVAPFTKMVLLPYKIRPNTITFVGMLLGLLAALMLALHLPALSIIFILLSGYADTIDGFLARVSNQQSDIGCIFDIVSDRIVEIAIILGLYFYAPASRSTYAILMMASVLMCITCFLVVSLFQSETEIKHEKSFFYSQGLMERAEAFIFFILMAAFPTYFKLLASLFIVLVSLTAGLHIFSFYLTTKAKAKLT